MAATGFIAGLSHLVDLRLEKGDILPFYSSQRADPLGARLLHDALADLRGLTVTRNRQPLQRLEVDEQTAVFLLGLDSRWLEQPVGNTRVASIEAMLSGGARVIMTISPESGGREDRSGSDTGSDTDVEPEAEGGAETATEADTVRDTENDAAPIPAAPEDEIDQGGGDPHLADPSAERRVLLGERWGFSPERLTIASDRETESVPAVARPTDAAPSPAEVTWRSTLGFASVEDPWLVLYRRGDRPVLIERRYLRGSLVLATDSFFLSNEGLSNERNTALLAALVGDRSRVIFDETVHGGNERPGIVALARRFRLHGFVVVGLLFLGLCLWRAVDKPVGSNVPDDEDDGGILTGRESRAALESLLRRSLSSHGALLACLAEWRSEFGDRNAALSSSLGPEPGASADPVAEYRRIHNLISQQRGRHVT